MYCKNCGIQLKENEKFCRICGTQVINNSNNITESKQSLIEDSVTKQQRKKIIESIIAYSVSLIIYLIGIISSDLDTDGNGIMLELLGLIMCFVCFSRYGLFATLRNRLWLKKNKKERIGQDIIITKKHPLYVIGENAFFETKRKLLIPFNHVAWVYTYPVVFIIPFFYFIQIKVKTRTKIRTIDGKVFRIKEDGDAFMKLYDENTDKFTNGVHFGNTTESKKAYKDILLKTKSLRKCQNVNFANVYD